MVEEFSNKPTATIDQQGAPAAKFPNPASLMGDFDFSKLFSEMKVPAMPDMEAFLATHKRNLEALSEANRVSIEGAQAVARRQFEIMQSAMAGMTESLKSLKLTDAPAAHAARQADMVREAYETAVSNTRELGDLIQKSSTEAIQRLNTRFSEALMEMKTLFKKP